MYRVGEFYFEWANQKEELMKFRNIWRRFKLNFRIINKKACTWTGAVYAVLGLIAVFSSLESVFEPLGLTSFWCKLLMSVSMLAVVYLVSFIIATVAILRKKDIKVLEGTDGHSVYVIYGNLFDADIVPSGTKRRNICFAVNRCFDTVVDNKLISEETLHGEAFKGLYDSGEFTPSTLDNAIQSSIIHGAGFRTLTAKQKPAGNLKRYEVGTGADLEISESLHYFLIGIGKMNENLRNKAENGEYCQAIQKMIEFFDTYSQGYPVLMPIVGAGLTRLGQNPSDLLKYLIQSLALNRSHLSSDIYIVLREEDREKITIANLKQIN